LTLAVFLAMKITLAETTLSRPGGTGNAKEASACGADTQLPKRASASAEIHNCWSDPPGGSGGAAAAMSWVSDFGRQSSP
jgi:hypothetical protein